MLKALVSEMVQLSPLPESAFTLSSFSMKCCWTSKPSDFIYIHLMNAINHTFFLEAVLMLSDADCPKGVERVKANTGNIVSGVSTHERRIHLHVYLQMQRSSMLTLPKAVAHIS